ncbi:NAD(P)-dependent dehydrogenase (short-subunit alcohol dehydrogenase family) [Rhodococcus erythropolis]|uniref:oxidoreductase n=1 Tax=Rhodococcus erythropolis TaxID=1833 RepID=UPI00216A12D3|nr:oxidoreductase [Rhodococcus erythropolis]MCS4255717.1 NAD(P)-dependent dehydrogenase (short-subunit alcohol dehydrogenase family) [Rhodococcus erythropolis]MCW2425231.1 NAD(P)-dependent dehydrogenase (short-subunit alcohol dehydrogenase family) [Rhodococcus erythropolis]
MVLTTERVALVTGASSGIGRSTASAFVDAGFTVVGTSRHAGTTAPILGVDLIDLDVTDDESVASAVREVLARFGRIDVLVNNAGVGSTGAAEDSSITQDMQVFDVNVFGVMRMTKAVLPHMRERRSGRIVNISSLLGVVPQPFMAAYAASKWAIEGYTESVDHEVREHGVRVVMVEPAWTNTAFEENNLVADRPVDAYAKQRSVFAEFMVESFAEGDEASVVSSAIVSAATDLKPKLRYAVTNRIARVAMMRRFVPTSAFDAQIRKLNRLPR